MNNLLTPKNNLVGKRLKLLVIGDEGVGKSTIVKTYCEI